MDLEKIMWLGQYAYIRTTDGKEFKSGDTFELAGVTWRVGSMTLQQLNDDSEAYSVICDPDPEHEPWCLEFWIKPECVSITAELSKVD